MDRFLQDLNDEQKIAVMAKGNVLITACPGSGKTRVLTHKLAIELGGVKSKEKLVALTFTNRAADEIRRRVAKFNIETNQLWTGTIHSFCLEWILKPYLGNLTELQNGFSIIDEYDAEQLIEQLKRKHNIPRFANIKRAYNLDGSFNVSDGTHLSVIHEYKATLQLRHLIDFDDILYYSYKLVTGFPIIGLRLSNLFPFICVDEYQDTQELQYAILAEIVKAGNLKTRMFFVGDISQAIYGSIGGVAKTVNEISQQFGGIEIDQLELAGNYRSTQRIIDYYSNYQLTEFDIVSLSDFADEPGTVIYETDIHRNDVHEHIAELILSYIDDGVPPNQICVVAPQWRMIIPMGRKLQSTLPQVDFDAYGLSPFRKVRDNVWYKMIRLFLSKSGNSNYSLSYQWVDELLVDIDQHLPQFLSHINNRRRFLLRLIRTFQSELNESIDYIKAAFHFFLESVNINLENYPALAERLESFIKVVTLELAREDFDYATDIAVLKRVFNSKNGVVISTCHGVKGEEYEVVISFGLLHGYIPNWGEVDRDAAKKLLYVICSRAKEHLHLISEVGHRTQRGAPYTPTTELSNVVFDYF